MQKFFSFRQRHFFHCIFFFFLWKVFVWEEQFNFLIFALVVIHREIWCFRVVTVVFVYPCFTAYFVEVLYRRKCAVVFGFQFEIKWKACGQPHHNANDIAASARPAAVAVRRWHPVAVWGVLCQVSWVKSDSRASCWGSRHTPEMFAVAKVTMGLYMLYYFVAGFVVNVAK